MARLKRLGSSGLVEAEIAHGAHVRVLEWLLLRLLLLLLLMLTSALLAPVGVKVSGTSSAVALTTATLNYARGIASHGVDGACERTSGLRNGLMTRGGTLLSEPVRKALNL